MTDQIENPEVTPKVTMPAPFNLGQHNDVALNNLMFNWREKVFPVVNEYEYREVMGYFVPAWQTEADWDESKQIAFIESVWRGLPIGTYSVNASSTESGALHNLLIDGRQRLNAIQRYLEDQFPVSGARWSELTATDQRRFRYSIKFPFYSVNSDDEVFLKEYHSVLNFGRAVQIDGILD